VPIRGVWQGSAGVLETVHCVSPTRQPIVNIALLTSKKLPACVFSGTEEEGGVRWQIAPRVQLGGHPSASPTEEVPDALSQAATRVPVGRLAFVNAMVEVALLFDVK